ncbi:MAG: GGDEF domain-containing protein [Rhodanobacteraceae bacterium]|nr:GGDEF domain-containing protein [Rhodanobacteraceae bacterium]
MPLVKGTRQLGADSYCLRSGLYAVAILLAVFCTVSRIVVAETIDIDQQLHTADTLKSSNYPEFLRMVQSIGEQQSTLTKPQVQYLNYLRGWERGYAGDYDAAIPLYNSVVSNSDDPVLRFRATASMISNLSIAQRYLEAYTHLDLLVGQMANTTDPLAREQGLHAAALLNNQAGQYELGLDYSTTLLREREGLRGECIARELRVESLYKLKKLQADGEEIRLGLQICNQHREVVFANIIRGFQAQQYIDTGRYSEAIDLLNRHYDEVQNTRYLRVISEFDIILAEANWHLGEIDRAHSYALRAIDKRVPNEVTDSLIGAYRLLYQIAVRRDDPRTALGFHEKYAEAYRQSLDDETTRSLAYQMAKHRALASRLEIEALNKKNQVLQLRQDLGAKAAETSRLYIALLISGLLLVFLWAFYTKRRQIYFRTLSERDSLTRIANRSRFLELSMRSLEECRRNNKEAVAILFDLDYFKLINDRYGHAAGDDVLRKVAAACRSYLGSNPHFGRLGGEEFSILLADSNEQVAVSLAEQLRKAVTVSATDGVLGEFLVSASFGVASTKKAGYELNHLLACADNAMYKAKLCGRDRVAVFEDGSLRPHPTDRQQITESVLDGIRN